MEHIGTLCKSMKKLGQVLTFRQMHPGYEDYGIPKEITISMHRIHRYFRSDEGHHPWAESLTSYVCVTSFVWVIVSCVVIKYCGRSLRGLTIGWKGSKSHKNSA